MWSQGTTQWQVHLCFGSCKRAANVLNVHCFSALFVPTLYLDSFNHGWALQLQDQKKLWPKITCCCKLTHVCSEPFFAMYAMSLSWLWSRNLTIKKLFPPRQNSTATKRMVLAWEKCRKAVFPPSFSMVCRFRFGFRFAGGNRSVKHCKKWGPCRYLRSTGSNKSRVLVQHTARQTLQKMRPL